MDRFPDDMVLGNHIPNRKDLVQSLRLERMRLYYEIKKTEMSGGYTLRYQDRIYNPEYLLILLKELNQRYPDRIKLGFKHKNKEFLITYDEFLEKYLTIPTFITIHIKLKDYPTKDSFCEYHNKIHTETELKENHQACISHGHCLYPISCPLNCDINKEYRNNVGDFSLK